MRTDKLSTPAHPSDPSHLWVLKIQLNSSRVSLNAYLSDPSVYVMDTWVHLDLQHKGPLHTLYLALDSEEQGGRAVREKVCNLAQGFTKLA